MRSVVILFLSVAGVFYANIARAQGGGPPMITDDPEVVGFHTWEINTSFNTSVTNKTQLAVPYLDINYGAIRNLHLNVQSAYLLTLDKQHHPGSALGEVILGIKYLFLEEDKNWISAGTYPHMTITGDQKGFLIPVLLEKTFGRFVLGEDLGIILSEHHYRSFQNGLLLGYKVSDKMQVMAEYFMEMGLKPTRETSGHMNYGFRYRLDKTFSLIGSFGEQIITPADEQKERFISFLGLQSDF